MEAIVYHINQLYWNVTQVILIALTDIYRKNPIRSEYHNANRISISMIEQADQLMPYYVMQSIAHIPCIAGMFTTGASQGVFKNFGFKSAVAVSQDDFSRSRL